MDATNYLRDAIVNFWLRNDPDSITAPASVWFGLFSVAPTAAGGGTELSHASYARVQMSWADPAGSGDSSEQVALDFPFPTGANYTVVACGVFDTSASAGDNLLMFDSFDTSFTVQGGNTLQFAIGDVDLEVR